MPYKFILNVRLPLLFKTFFFSLYSISAERKINGNKQENTQILFVTFLHMSVLTDSLSAQWGWKWWESFHLLNLYSMIKCHYSLIRSASVRCCCGDYWLLNVFTWYHVLVMYLDWEYFLKYSPSFWLVSTLYPFFE